MLVYDSSFVEMVLLLILVLLIDLNVQHIGQSPLPAYEPAFDWENERTLIFGQRIPETPVLQYVICEMFLSRVYFHLFLFFLAQLSFFCQSFSVWHLSGMKISVKVQSLQFQAGLAGECFAVDIGGIMW